MSRSKFSFSAARSSGWLIWLLPMTLMTFFVAVHLVIPQSYPVWPGAPGKTDTGNDVEALNALSHELDALVHMELLQRVQEQLTDPHVIAKSVSDVVAEELSIVIRAAGDNTMHEASAGVPQALQGAAMEHVEARLREALDAGYWRAEDTQAVLPHLGVISPEDRVELLRRFHEALAQGRLELDGPMPPL